MIELVFVIVVLGILASVAIPKLAANRSDAHIANARATISAIRSGIVSLRQKTLLRGSTAYINKISSGASGVLFDGNGSTGYEILMYPVKSSSSDGHWSGTDPNYVFKIKGQSCNFTYSSANGTFKLNASQPAVCNDLDF